MKKLILFTIAFSLIGCKTMQEKASIPVYEHAISQKEIDSLSYENITKVVMYGEKDSIDWGKKHCKSFTVIPDTKKYAKNQFIIKCLEIKEIKMERKNDR